MLKLAELVKGITFTSFHLGTQNIHKDAASDIGPMLERSHEDPGRMDRGIPARENTTQTTADLHRYWELHCANYPQNHENPVVSISELYHYILHHTQKINIIPIIMLQSCIFTINPMTLILIGGLEHFSIDWK